MAGVKGMHARASTSPHHAEAVRSRIQSAVIADRLQKHMLGKVKMTATQVRAAEILLRKAVPDLSSVDLSGSLAQNLTVSVVDYLKSNAV